MILIKNVSLRRGTKAILEGADATLQNGQKIALIGANGSGKSSFFALLLGKLQLDQGDITGAESLRIAHMAQELVPTEEAALDYVLRGHEKAYQLLTSAALAEREERFDDAAEIHHQLDQIKGYEAPRQAERLLLGLGFSTAQCQSSVRSFSGGWRIRLNLAQALMTPSDLLLLDEPTNHLDLDATLWLQDWLKRYPGTLLMISHDRDFIDATCERVLKIQDGQLLSYRGGYSDYERQRAEQLAQQQAQFEKQQLRKQHIESFVRRFKAKATKAKQAQSRIKELERMQELAPAHIDSPFEFAFPEPGKTSDPLLTLDEATLGYRDKPILEHVSLSLRPADRIGLLGKNGAGKSTLLKTLARRLSPLSGEYHAGTHLRVGYFDQQQLEVLDLEASPLLHLQRLSPEAREQELLNFLGGFDFRGDMATSPIQPFSGGEKARLALAMVVWENPNVLVLDEPTNHLDLEMRHALEVALQSYEGALLLVSHDRHLIRNTVEELWLVGDGCVAPFDGDLESYERWIVTQPRQNEVPGQPPSHSTAQDTIVHRGGDDKKQQRQRAAQQREQRKPLQRQLDKTEATMSALETELTAIDHALTDTALYEDTGKVQLTALLKEQGAIKQKLDTLEETWLALQEQLEAFDT